MKKINLILSAIFIGLLIFISCSDDTELAKKIKLTKNTISLKVGEKQSIKITQGNGGYKVTSSNKGVAASVKGSVVTVNGVSAGEAVVTLTDSKNEKGSLKVLVAPKDITVDSENVVVKKNEEIEVEITSGSGDYSATVKGDVTAEIKDKKVVITGVKTGKAQVSVTDKVTKKSVLIKVNVTVDALVLSTNNLTLKKGSHEVVDITSGSGEYIVESTKPAIAKVEKEGAKLTITAIGNGVTDIIVKDTEAGIEKKIKVTVTVDALETKESVKDIIRLSANETKTLHITSGSGDYSVESSAIDYVKADLEEKKVVLTAVSVDTYEAKSVKIKIIDKASKATKEFTVNVFSKLVVGGGKVDLKEGESREIAIVSGDMAVVKVSTDKEGVATARMDKDNKVIIIKATGEGAAKIKVTDGVTTKYISVNVKAIPAFQILAVQGMQGTVVYDENNSTVKMVYATEENSNGIITVKGSGRYKITGDYSDKLLIGDYRDLNTGDKGTFDITAKGKGAFTVKITDEATGKSADLKFTITKNAEPFKVTFSSSSDAEFDNKPKSDSGLEIEGTITMKVGQTGTFNLTGGSSKYVAQWSRKGTEGVIKFTDPDKTNTNVSEITAVKEGIYFIKLKDYSSKPIVIKHYKIVVEKASSIAYANVKISPSGIISKKDAEASMHSLEGDLVLPNEAKIVPSNNEPFTPFKGNKKIVSIDFGGVEDIQKMSTMQCGGLRSVVFRNVTHIGTYAFYNCPKLVEVRCLTKIPPTVETQAFKKISEDAVLYVPSGTRDAYQNSKMSKYFKEIKEM